MSEHKKGPRAVNYLLLVPLILAACNSPGPEPSPTETENAAANRSPVIICSAPDGLIDKQTHPNATIWIYFERRDPKDPNMLSFETQLFEGSQSFEPNPDGSLNEVEIPKQDGDKSTLVHTGVDVFLPIAKTSNGAMVGVDLEGCLVDATQKQQLQKFLAPGSRFNGQIGRIDSLPVQNPFRGDRHIREQLHASKPVLRGRILPGRRM